MSIFEKNTEKHTEKLPMTGKVKKGFRIYCTAIMGAALVLGTSVTAFAAGDPITVINNLSTFIFGLIRAIGLMIIWRLAAVEPCGRMCLQSMQSKRIPTRTTRRRLPRWTRARSRSSRTSFGR